MLPSTRTLLATGFMAAAVSASIAAALFATSASAQAPTLGTQPYTLSCWQDGVQVLTRREDQALQSLTQPFERGLTLENADGSRRVLAPMGDALCVLEFTAAHR